MNKLFEIFVIALAIAGHLSCFGVEHCRECDGLDSKCKKCDWLFYSSESGCDRVKDEELIANCVSHIIENSLIKCQECEMGFYLFDQSGTKSCKACENSGCPFCGSDGKCLACYNSDIKSEQRKSKFPCEHEICIANCEICNDLKRCYKCANGFAINEDKSECILSSANCQVVERKDLGWICKVCNSGHIIQDNGTCEKSKDQFENGAGNQGFRERKLRNEKDLL